MKKVLIVHNISWSHYKAAVFSALHRIAPSAGFQLVVVNLGETESMRRGMRGANECDHRYPHEVLFKGAIESVPAWRRSIALTKALFRHSPDIVVISGYYDSSYWVSLMIMWLKRKTIFVAVDSTEYDKPRKAKWKEVLKRIFLSFADGVFGYGTRSKEYCLKLGVPEARIYPRCQATDNTFIRKLFDNARLAECPKRLPAFIYVGRLSTEKNIKLLVDTFLKLTSEAAFKNAPWDLIIVGTGPLESEFKDISHAPGGTHIKLIGGVAWDVVPEYYAQTDVLILPSLSEPWGLVVNEAMVCGLAVIVSIRCGCAPDLVQGQKTGYTFDPTSGDDLKAKMLSFVLNPGLAPSMGQAGEKWIEAFSPESAAASMLLGFKDSLNWR